MLAHGHQPCDPGHLSTLTGTPGVGWVTLQGNKNISQGKSQQIGRSLPPSSPHTLVLPRPGQVWVTDPGRFPHNLRPPVGKECRGGPSTTLCCHHTGSSYPGNPRPCPYRHTGQLCAQTHPSLPGTLCCDRMPICNHLTSLPTLRPPRGRCRWGLGPPHLRPGSQPFHTRGNRI